MRGSCPTVALFVGRVGRNTVRCGAPAQPLRHPGCETQGPAPASQRVQGVRKVTVHR